MVHCPVATGACNSRPKTTETEDADSSRDSSLSRWIHRRSRDLREPQRELRLAIRHSGREELALLFNLEIQNLHTVFKATSQFTATIMGWWSKSQDPPQEPPKITSEDAKKKFDPDKLPTKEKLPKSLQAIVDKAHEDESFFDKVVDGQ